MWVLYVVMKPSISWVATLASAKLDRFRHFRLRIENQTSTKLSQDAWTGRKWNTKARCGCASSQLFTSADQCELAGSRMRWIGWPDGVRSSSKANNSQNSRDRCLWRTMPHTWPSLTRKPASKSTVPLRAYSNSRLAGRAWAGRRRGSGGWSGAVGWRTPMPGFSSTQNKEPSAGGLSSNSMMATALVANSGSRSFIHVLKTVQADLVPFQHDADGALAGMPEAELGVSGHVLSQVLDGPVGLPDACRVDLRGWLAGQHQQARLDISVILARRWTFGVVLEAIQTLCDEAVSPDEDGADSQTHFTRDRGVGLAVSDAQNDLGAI